MTLASAIISRFMTGKLNNFLCHQPTLNSTKIIAMPRFAKNTIKKLLAKRGYELTWTPSTEVTGTLLPRDLTLLLPKTGAVCFDVGANTGQTLQMLLKALHSPSIFAFEPTPAVFGQLIEGTWGENVRLHNLALGKSVGTTTVNLYEHSVLNSILPLEKNRDSPFTGVRSLGTAEVKISTVDAVASDYKLEKIDLLKIDTQGYDLEVLLGAEQMLQTGRIDHVLIELNYIRLYEGQCSYLQIQDLMESHSFRLVDLYEKFRLDHAISWCTALFRRSKNGTSNAHGSIS